MPISNQHLKLSGFISDAENISDIKKRKKNLNIFQIIKSINTLKIGSGVQRGFKKYFIRQFEKMIFWKQQNVRYWKK